MLAPLGACSAAAASSRQACTPKHRPKTGMPGCLAAANLSLPSATAQNVLSVQVGTPEMTPVQAYLDVPGIVRLAKEQGVDVIHPG